jgi:hypothetical protein
MSSSKQTPSGLASGHGIATLSGTTVLDVWFPNPTLGALTGQPEKSLSSLVGVDEVRKVKRELVSIEIDLAVCPTKRCRCISSPSFTFTSFNKAAWRSDGWNLWTTN